MGRHLIILIFGLTFGLLSCNSSADNHETLLDHPSHFDSLKLIKNKKNETNTALDKREDCTRGQAEPIFKKGYYPKTTFVLQPDSLTAIETINFDNGDKLTVRNWGCEYYTLTFRFETSRFHEDVNNIPVWFKNTVLLMSELFASLDAPIDIKKGVDKLVNHIDLDMLNNYANLKFGQEIDFGGNEIRDFLNIEKVERITDQKFAITISFSTGPL